MCSVFAALQQMGFRFSPEFIKFLISKSDLQNHKHMSVDGFIVVCVQIQRFTGKIEDFGCSLNNSQELVLILGNSTWSAATAYHSSSKIVILCHALLCALEPGGCTWLKIHVSCKCSGSYGGTFEVGSPFIWAVLLHHWVIGVYRTLEDRITALSSNVGHESPTDAVAHPTSPVLPSWIMSFTFLTDNALLCFYSVICQRIIKST
jgi:hypothetical protein